MKGTVRCRRCSRRWRGAGEWNVVFKDGEAQYYLCPQCQTPEENAEAVIKEATLDYGVDAFGRPMARPKGDG